MPTKNIKTDYGAAGNGQFVRPNITFSLSTPDRFTVFSNLFVSGDVGKRIAIEGIVPVDNGSGNTMGALLATITAVSAFSSGSQTVTFTGLTPTTTGSVAVTNAAKYLEWGTDDTAAFNTFRDAYVGQTGVVLTVPPGRYCFFGVGGNNMPFKGLIDLVVNGDSGSNPIFAQGLTAGGGYHLGSALTVVNTDGSHEARTVTVAAGATTIVLQNNTLHSLFTPPCWGWMQGFDVQGFGFPPSPQFSEFVYITAKHVGTGGGDPSTLTVSVPLMNTYKSTWPLWYNGTPGPATIYPVTTTQGNWDATHVYNNIIISAYYTVVNCNGRSITFNGGGAESYGPNCSMNHDFTCDGFTNPSLWELDKGTTYCTIKNATWRGIHCQSQWATHLTLDNVHLTNFLNGTGNNCVINNCTIDVEPIIGVTSYGAPTSISINNTYIASPILVLGGGNNENITTDYSYVGSGVLRKLKDAGDGGPPLWAIPGAYCWLTSRHPNDSGKFLVSDVYTDATYTYVQTDLTSMPTGIVGTSSVRAGIAFPPVASFSNVTGSRQMLSLSANPSKKFGEYWLATYTASDPAFISVWGKVVSIKVTVNPGYTAGTFKFDPFFIYFLNNNTRTDIPWTATFSLASPGVRTITPSGVTGSLGSDSIDALPANPWFHSDQASINFAGAVGSGSVTVEVITDQGWTSTSDRIGQLWALGNAPTRLRAARVLFAGKNVRAPPGSTVGTAYTMTAGFGSAVLSGRAVTLTKTTVTTYQGPGDIIGGGFAWWGLRGYSGAYSTGSNPAIDIVDQAGSNLLTVNILANGKLDVASISAWVTTYSVSTIKVKKMYDQVGTRPLVQNTLTAMPVLNLTGFGSLPALEFDNATSQFMAVGGGHDMSQPFSGSLVWKKPAGGGSMEPMNFGPWILTTDAAEIMAYAGTILIQSSVANGSWHASQVVFNNTSGAIYTDGASVTGTIGANVAFGNGMNLGAPSVSFYFTGSIAEAGWWSTAFSSTQAGNTNTNQHTYWGF